MRRAVLVAIAAAACACGTPGRSFHPPRSYDEGPGARAFGAARDEEPSAKESPPHMRWRAATPRPPIERRLSNGVPVVIAQRRDFPSAEVLFVLDRGTAAAAPGVAALYGRALLGDSAAFDEREAHAYLRFVGASVSSWAWSDAVVLRVTALSPFLASALSRAAPMFVSPKLTSKNIDEAKTLFTDEHDEEDGGSIARRSLVAGLFPAPHPYAIPSELVTASDVAKIERDALTSFRNAYVNAGRVRVIATGDVDPDALVRMLERELAALPKADASTPPTFAAIPAPSCSGRVRIVDRPGAAQSSIAIGWPGVAAADDDAAALELLAAASGGWLSSRLNLTVRKELGATYGVHARAETLRHGGTVELTAAVDTPKTADALAGMLAEMDRLRREPLEPAELDGAKTKALYGGSARSNVTAGVLLARAAAFGLGPSHVADQAQQRSALSAEDVRATAERRLDPALRCIVVVGDAARITQGISALGLGALDLGRAAR